MYSYLGRDESQLVGDEAAIVVDNSLANRLRFPTIITTTTSVGLGLPVRSRPRPITDYLMANYACYFVQRRR